MNTNKNYTDNISLAIYNMGGQEHMFSKSEETADGASTSESCKNQNENKDSSCSYPTNSSDYYKNRIRSKSMSYLDPSISSGEVTRMREKLLRTNSHVEKSQLRNFSSTQKLTLVLLALVDFMGFCSMSIMAPFFPKEATNKGLNATVIGFIFSFHALIMFLTSPIFGKILPKIGTKCLFLVGILVAGGSNILFGFLVHVNNFSVFTTLCIIIRSFEALGVCAYSTASYVYVVNTFPHSIGSVLGILETFVGLGMSTGPAIGGFLYSLGGFSLPFLILGIAMVTIVPLNLIFLPNAEDCSMSNKSTSFLKLIKIKEVLVIGLVVTVASSTWAFLDPTLEPYLRQFNLTPEKVGLVFLLFSALYAMASPIWGWLADKVDNHWSMMVVGLFMCSLGLILLGPSPFIPWLKNYSSLWLILVSLSLLGVSVALTLLPTFRGILTSATNAGHREALSTYSVVAGIWSCLYSLGEVIGPSLGGFLLQFYGFPVMSSVMAAITFSVGVLTLIFFVMKNSSCNNENGSISDSGINESWKNTSSTVSSDEESNENTPLLYSRTDQSEIRNYIEEKIQNYEQSRRIDEENGEMVNHQVTNIRNTVSITGKGACEV